MSGGLLVAGDGKKRQAEQPSFSKRLYAEISKKDATMPIIIGAAQTEVDEFLKINEEDLHLRWRFWNGQFIVEELNSLEHENAIGECILQLGEAIRRVQVPGMVASLSPSLNAPEGYPNANGKIKPDACIMNKRKKVSARAAARGMAATDCGRFYPSVEVAFSQSKESLAQKVNAWLVAGNNRTGVRCVIEINIDDDETEEPPAWMKFRVHRRGQTRVPLPHRITAQEYAENPNNPRYRQVLTAQEVCYPANVPDGFQDVILDFGRVYASLPGVGDEIDRDDNDGSNDDEVGEGLANLSSGGDSKRQRTA